MLREGDLFKKLKGVFHTKPYSSWPFGQPTVKEIVAAQQQPLSPPTSRNSKLHDKAVIGQYSEN